MPSPGGGHPAAIATRAVVNPFRKSLAALQIGDTMVGGPRTVTLEDIEQFAQFTGDTFYASTTSGS